MAARAAWSLPMPSMSLSRIFLIAAALCLFARAFVVDLYFDWLWFEEVAKTVVFTTALYARGTVGSGVLFVVFLFIYANLWYSSRAPGRIQIGIPTPAGQ